MRCGLSQRKEKAEYNEQEDHDRRDERKRGHLLPARHDRNTVAMEAVSTWHSSEKKKKDYQIEPLDPLPPSEEL